MHARAAEATLPEHERAMLAYGVSHDGHRYLYNGYRYDRWEDAVDQAELMLSRPLEKNPAGPFTQQSAHADAPSDADLGVMASLGIRPEAGLYRFEGYRYDRLADAIAYARLVASRQFIGPLSRT
jgi:hypothetical protein